MFVALEEYDQGERSSEKKGYFLTKIEVAHAHQLRVTYYDGVQSVVKTTRSLRERFLLKEAKKATLKKNRWKNLNVMLRLNPYAKTAKKMVLLVEAKQLD